MAPSNGSRCHPSQTGLVSRWPVNSRWGPLLPLSTFHSVFRRPSKVFSHQTVPTPSDLSFASRSRASVSSLPFVLSMRTMSCVRPIEVSAANDAPTFSNTKAFIFFLLIFRVRGPTTPADFMNVLIALQCSGYQAASHEHRPMLRSGGDEILDILRVGDQQIGAGADRDAPVRAETEDRSRRSRD